jgi:hypothetical protein
LEEQLDNEECAAKNFSTLRRTVGTEQSKKVQLQADKMELVAETSAYPVQLMQWSRSILQTRYQSVAQDINCLYSQSLIDGCENYRSNKAKPEAPVSPVGFEIDLLSGELGTFSPKFLSIQPLDVISGRDPFVPQEGIVHSCAPTDNDALQIGEPVTAPTREIIINPQAALPIYESSSSREDSRHSCDPVENATQNCDHEPTTGLPRDASKHPQPVQLSCESPTPLMGNMHKLDSTETASLLQFDESESVPAPRPLADLHAGNYRVTANLPPPSHMNATSLALEAGMQSHGMHPSGESRAPPQNKSSAEHIKLLLLEPRKEQVQYVEPIKDTAVLPVLGQPIPMVSNLEDLRTTVVHLPDEREMLKLAYEECSKKVITL